MDFGRITQLTFEQPDSDKFPCLRLAYEAIQKGATYPAVLNAANEIAVYAFLERIIKFTDIAEIIERLLQDHKPIENPVLEDFLTIDTLVRKQAEKICKMKL